MVEFEVDGHSVRAFDTVYAVDGAPTAEARAFAREIIASFDELRHRAAGKFLALYNDTWRDEEEGQEVLDEAGFCARLIEPSITLMDEPGSAVVFFEDSDMFAGHSIQVSLHQREVDNVTLVG